MGPALLIDPSIWRRARVQSRTTRLISNSIARVTVGCHQPEGIAEFLMARKGVPEVVDENADQLVDGVEAFKLGQFPVASAASFLSESNFSTYCRTTHT